VHAYCSKRCASRGRRGVRVSVVHVRLCQRSLIYHTGFPAPPQHFFTITLQTTTGARLLSLTQTKHAARSSATQEAVPIEPERNWDSLAQEVLTHLAANHLDLRARVVGSMVCSHWRTALTEGMAVARLTAY
jgi:hypothetical protein